MLIAVLAGLLRLPWLLEDHVAVEVIGRLVNGRVRAHGQGDGRTAEAIICLLNAMLPPRSTATPVTLLESVPSMANYLVRESGSDI